jgi:hypothetical protein
MAAVHHLCLGIHASQRLQDDDELVKPMHELPNPYAEWAGKTDLASAALSRLDNAAGAEGKQPPGTTIKLKLSAAAAIPGGGSGLGHMASAWDDIPALVLVLECMRGCMHSMLPLLVMGQHGYGVLCDAGDHSWLGSQDNVLEEQRCTL